MCDYLKENVCIINKQNCPFVYFCNKNNKWLPSKFMPVDCKIKSNVVIPKGQYRVCFSRHNELYVQVGDRTLVFENPFDYVPTFVKLVKKNGKWAIKK